jgi:hypothetical protein
MALVLIQVDADGALAGVVRQKHIAASPFRTSERPLITLSTWVT